MHYIGMAAMVMDADIRYLPRLFVLSILIAVSASAVALYLLHKLTHTSSKRGQLRTLSALIMGGAICAMHYIGMAATVFIPKADCRFDVIQDFTPLALSIWLVVCAIIGIALGCTVHWKQSESDQGGGRASSHSRAYNISALC